MEKLSPSYYSQRGNKSYVEVKHLGLSNILLNFRLKGIDKNLHYPILISNIAGNNIVRKVLIDQGNSADILFLSTFRKVQFSEASLTPYSGDLVGFLRKRLNVEVMFNYE